MPTKTNFQKANASLLANAKGDFVIRGSTKVGKAIAEFATAVRDSYGDRWTGMQEARLSVALPWFKIYLTTPSVTPKGKVNKAWRDASGHLVLALQDINNMSDGRPRSMAKANSAKWLEKFASGFLVEKS